MLPELRFNLFSEASLLIGKTLSSVFEFSRRSYHCKCCRSFLELLLREYCIDLISKISPTNMIFLVGRGKRRREQLKFRIGQRDFRHAQAQTKLLIRDIPTTQLIEIPQELWNAQSLLFGFCTQLAKQILDIIGNLIMNEWLHLIRRFFVSFKRIGIRATDCNTFIININIPTELVIVDFIESTLIRISLQNQIQCVFGREQTELIQNSQELILRNIALFRLIEVFKVRLNQHSLILDFLVVQNQQRFQSLFLIFTQSLNTQYTNSNNFFQIKDSFSHTK